MYRTYFFSTVNHLTLHLFHPYPSLLDPDLSVTIIPQQLTVPDQPPYNTFTLTCMVSGLEYLAIEPFVNWLSGETNSTYNYTVNIVNNETTWYVLHIENKTAGNFEYRCEVNLPDDSMFVYTTTAIVLVKGNILVYCLIHTCIYIIFCIMFVKSYVIHLLISPCTFIYMYIPCN